MATIRTNDLYLDMSGFDEVDFEVTEYKVSEGQDYEKKDNKLKVDIHQEGSTWKLTIYSGRHGTDEVAKWFNDRVKGGACIANASNDIIPEKLNFAVKGTLKLVVAGKEDVGDKTYLIPDVVIAQGHNTAGNNNWWIGGKEFGDAAKLDMFAHLVKFKAIKYTVERSLKKLVATKQHFVFYTSGNANRFNVTHIKSEL